MALRANKRLITVQIESTAGEDPGAPTVPDDVLDVASFDRDSGIGSIEIQELRGALDDAAPVPGVEQPTGSGRLQLKGSGAVATAPVVGRLFRIGGFEENVRTVVPASGTSAIKTGTGTTTGFTIDRSAETDWSATDGFYVGRVVRLTVNPTTAAYAVITSYEVTGDDCVVVLDKTFSPTLGNTTEVEVMPGVQYQLHSGTIPTASIKDYVDGTRAILLGSMADLSLNLSAGAPWELAFQTRSVFPTTPYDDTALPSYLPSTTIRPPIWRRGGWAYGVARQAIERFTVNLGNRLENPPNPNAVSGIDATELVGRAVGGDGTPLQTLAATRNLLADARAQTVKPLTAFTDESASAGNRWALCLAQAVITTHRNAAAGSFAAEGIAFRTNGIDANALSLLMW